jgi:hypothetical protein
MPQVEIRIAVAVRITEEEARGLDPKLLVVAISAPPAPAEVEGQTVAGGVTRCPWCGQFVRSMSTTTTRNWFRCGGCGGAFKE